MDEKRINLKISNELKKKFKSYCVDNDTTITKEIIKFIESKVSKEDK